MSRFGLNLELDVDAAGGRDLAAVAVEWFDTASNTALHEPRSAMENGGPAPLAPRFVDPAAWNPAGAPVRLSGTWSVSSRRPKTFDARSMGWLRTQLAEKPERVSLRFALRAGTEPDAPNVWYPSLYADYPEDSPGWLRIGAYVAESAFLDAQHGAEAQRLWLGLLRSFADWLDPGFGQVEYGYDTEGTTGLEWSLPADVPLEERDAGYTVGQSRRFLRGYSWLTVVPADLVQRLGGVAALTDSGIFAEVSALRNGGMWLLATGDYRDYGAAQAEALFRVLAPVLRPGRPEPFDGDYGYPPQRVVFEDAATAGPAS